MKIAIAGAHRVGKTTLAEELIKHLPGYVLKKEPYHELEESGYDFSEIPEADDFIAQFEYAVEQISEDDDKVIFDRCPVDLLAYIHAIDRSRNIQSLFATAQEIIEEIDLLVFVPIEEPDVISYEKSDFPKLRNKVNDILNEWIWDFDIETIEVHGTLANRRNQILNKISKIPIGN